MNQLTVVFYKIALCVQETTASLTFGVIYDETKGMTATLGQGGKPAAGLTRPAHKNPLRTKAPKAVLRLTNLSPKQQAG